MSEYINFEAEAEHIEGDEVRNFSDVSEYSFIHDTDQDTDVNFYRENDIKQVLQETYEESLKDLDKGSEEDLEIDDFKNSEVDIKKFGDTLFPKVVKECQKVRN